MWDGITSVLNSIGGVGGGLAILIAVMGFTTTHVLPLVLPTPMRALLGEWWCYAYFHDRDSDVPAPETRRSMFYKEKIVVHHRKIFPWLLWFEAVPLTKQVGDGRSAPPTRYRGAVWYRSSRVFVRAREPIYDDTYFEILRRVMDEQHSDNMLVGIALGDSYDHSVYEATGIVMSRRPLVCNSSSLSEDQVRDEEMKVFDALAAKYLRLKKGTYELLLT